MQPETLDQVPDLPSPGQRWTVRRKAAVIEAVRGGWMPIEDACELYNIFGRSGLGTRYGPAWRARFANNAISNLSRYRCAAGIADDLRRYAD